MLRHDTVDLCRRSRPLIVALPAILAGAIKSTCFAVLTCVAVLAPAPAHAVVDPDVDSMGIYFDERGDMNCAAVPPLGVFDAWLILANPNLPVDGFECTVTIAGAACLALSADLGPGAIDVDPATLGYMVGAPAPYRQEAAMKLVHWQFMRVEGGFSEFFIGDAARPSLPGGWPVVTGNGVLRRCGVQSGHPDLPVAYVTTGLCGTPVETATFGAIKSLYR